MMKITHTAFLMGLSLSTLHLVAHAETVPWAGAFVDPDDPESAINQPENLQAYNEAYATEEDLDASQPLAFGPNATTIYNIGPSDWQVRGNTFDLGLNNDQSIGPSTSVTAPLHLPSGALITSATIFYNDTGGSNPSAGLWCSNTTGGDTIVSNFDPCFPAFSGGNRACTISSINHTVNNQACHYGVLLVLNANNRMYRVRINYRLQQSPAPAVATFSDVPTSSIFYQSIEALAASGITVGCGGSRYCPDRGVTRAEMAAFLARSLGLHWPN